MIKISEIEQIFKDIFNDGDESLVKSIETLYEVPTGGGDFLKLVISLHGLSFDDVSIIHTKFIFKVDKDKNHLISNSFVYLYGLNCNYHRVEYENIFGCKKKIEDIIKSNDFGEDIIILSDFIEAPAMFLNYYMKRNDITEYSVFSVIYEPKFKTTPCRNMTFDFKININNTYEIDLSIRKIMGDKDKDTDDYYKFQFKFMGDIETIETESISNIHYFIGSNISSILDKKLKNKTS